MSATAVTMFNTAIATRFYGGTARGKVVQIHLDRPEDLSDDVIELLVEDSDTGFIEPFGEWLRRETANAGMVLFAGHAEPKVQTIEISMERTR